MLGVRKDTFNISLFDYVPLQRLIMDSKRRDPLGIENRLNTITFHLTLPIFSQRPDYIWNSDFLKISFALFRSSNRSGNCEIKILEIRCNKIRIYHIVIFRNIIIISYNLRILLFCTNLNYIQNIFLNKAHTHRYANLMDKYATFRVRIDK